MTWRKQKAMPTGLAKTGDNPVLEAALAIAGRPSDDSPADLFELALEQLIRAFDASHAFIAVTNDRGNRLSTLAFFANGQPDTGFEYEL
ncbi:MAG: hypothetical protein PVF93_09300, partial [Chromatiaceae bacterium]